MANGVMAHLSQTDAPLQLLDLPDDVLALLLSHAEVASIGAFAQASRRCRAVTLVRTLSCVVWLLPLWQWQWLIQSVCARKFAAAGGCGVAAARPLQTRVWYAQR